MTGLNESKTPRAEQTFRPFFLTIRLLTSGQRRPAFSAIQQLTTEN
jgi:hypothetical protein